MRADDQIVDYFARHPRGTVQLTRTTAGDGYACSLMGDHNAIGVGLTLAAAVADARGALAMNTPAEDARLAYLFRKDAFVQEGSIAGLVKYAVVPRKHLTQRIGPWRSSITEAVDAAMEASP